MVSVHKVNHNPLVGIIFPKGSTGCKKFIGHL